MQQEEMPTSAPVTIRFEPADDGSSVRCVVDVADSSIWGRSAELRVVQKAVVKDERPVNASHTILTRRIDALQARNELMIHRATMKVFTYRGTKVDIQIWSELEIDDGVLFDSTIREEELIAIADKPEVSSDAPGTVQPSDAFDFQANFAAIPARNKMIVSLLALCGSIVIALNSIVGVHDQLAPDPAVWFYDHRASDGDSESPLGKSLAGSGVVGAALWAAIRRQLRKYMTFELQPLPGRIGRDDSVSAAAIVRGVPRVPLDGALVRVVACNVEKGQYKRRRGTKDDTISFSEPVRAVILYEKRIEHLPAGSPVERTLDGEIRFEPMFRALYPPQPVGTHHGIEVQWEVQLIHELFVDQELKCPDGCFEWKDFLLA